ncbi:MAG: YdcF family protein [Paramuribaculum sp.]|nr:YdcF family protein [Paramuribaculum sp.]
MKPTTKKLIFIAGISVIIIISAIIAIHRIVAANSQGRTFDSACETPHNSVGLLLATSPRTADGSRNLHFDSRIEAAALLFKAGKIDWIIASGGDYRAKVENGADEPQAIRDSLVARGVPAERILPDYEGTRTLNSIVKAKDVFGLDSVTIISQKFHNERAIYLADRAGMHAIGFNAAPAPVFPNRLRNELREYPARVKMFIDIITHKKADVKTGSIQIPTDQAINLSDE